MKLSLLAFVVFLVVFSFMAVSARAAKSAEGQVEEKHKQESSQKTEQAVRTLAEVASKSALRARKLRGFAGGRQLNGTDPYMDDEDDLGFDSTEDERVGFEEKKDKDDKKSKKCKKKKKGLVDEFKKGDSDSDDGCGPDAGKIVGGVAGGLAGAALLGFGYNRYKKRQANLELAPRRK